MSKYESLLEEAVQNGIYVLENIDFESKSKGLINGDVIGLSANLKTEAERACTLAEELGHHKLNCGNILNQKDDTNRKQEKKARLWAYKKMITLDKLIDACLNGCQNRYEIAEYLDVTEEFLQDAIDSYRSKFGKTCYKGNYLITFEPALAVHKLVWLQAE
ncbi:hypothetical protein C0033_09035 [Clostridium sp. chh4-2]|uniref:ImmA/IrrE family metallo-endopeptidase n=1 Tax=Clostridium sp. chh4-2 TaxID=2067550 RepID=UPI000CCE528D|nr:ImmA/IrrE family metallo-endopeptidase [Clostridium sp. chh4-2]PNV62246.1 hypothetical protein C0033_09035 [Clostridium sp. chh4-2]